MSWFRRKFKEGDLVTAIKPVHGEVSVSMPGEVFKLSDVHNHRGTICNGFSTIINVPIKLLRKASGKDCVKYLQGRLK